jgi:2-dehydropantoate 2-reductase
MKICIFGAGAVGGVMAGWLQQAGHEVSVVARGRNLTAIREHGLRIRTLATGEETAYPVRAESDPAQLGPQDCVIVTVKAQR